MTIETKYNIGDEVWAIVENEVQCQKIGGVSIKTTTPLSREDGSTAFYNVTIKYYLWEGNWVDECKCFPTKEELLKSL